MKAFLVVVILLLAMLCEYQDRVIERQRDAMMWLLVDDVDCRSVR